MAERVAAITIPLLFLLCLTLTQQERCSGPIGGKDAEIAATPSRAQMFYLNTDNPALCTGSITSWRVCYYRPDAMSIIDFFWATYAVYRRMEADSSVHYVRVSEIFRAIRTNIDYISIPEVDGEIAQGGFNCYTDSLDAGASPLAIQAGDILGACVFDPDGDIFEVLTTLPLHVVGETSSGEPLLQMGIDGCSRQALPSDIPANRLTVINSRRLHIYANIDVELTTTHAASTANVTSTGTRNITGTLITTTNPSTTATNSILSSQMRNSRGSQTGRDTDALAGIVAGSTVGGLIILILLVVVIPSMIYLVLRRKILSANVHKDDSNTTVEKWKAEDIVTNTNPAYKSAQWQRASANHEFEVVYATAGLGESTTEPELKERNETQNSTLKMERNVAYQSSNTVQISLHRNVAYCESREVLNENNHADDDDYI